MQPQENMPSQSDDDLPPLYFPSMSHVNLFNILTSSLQYLPNEFTESDFIIDLIIKLKVPEKQYIPIDSNIQLHQFVIDVDKVMEEVYQLAENIIIEEMAESGQKTKGEKDKAQTRSMLSLKKLQEVRQNKRKIQKTQECEEEQITFDCHYEKMPILDSFTLKLNSIIYILQHKCGFQVRTLMIPHNQSNYIFLLLTQNDRNLMKLAHKYGIKKKIDYWQIDPWLNEPVDSSQRPIKFNKFFIGQDLLMTMPSQQPPGQSQNLQNIHPPASSAPALPKKRPSYHQPLNLTQRKHQHKEQANLKNQTQKKFLYNITQEHSGDLFSTEDQGQVSFIQTHKQISRAFKIPFQHLQIPLQQIKLSEKQIQNFLAFQKERKEIFEQIKRMPIQLTGEQKSYIFSIKNDINGGCMKQYKRVKRLREYCKRMKNLCFKYSYKAKDPILAYEPFMLPPKQSSYFNKLNSLLLYEPSICSPNGQLSLFLRMERIKLSYFCLRECFRVEHLARVGGEVFCLGNQFQKWGRQHQQLQVGKRKHGKQLINGGLNDKNLQNEWHQFFPWSTDIETIRNYLGQKYAYHIHLKSHLLQYFILAAPIGGIAQLISQVWVTNGNQYKFFLIYLLIFIICYSVSLAFWSVKEQTFMQNYVQDGAGEIFNIKYVGPFIRNPFTDKINEHPLEGNIISKLKQLIAIIAILVLLVLDGVMFFLLRKLLISIYYYFPDSHFYIVQIPHLIVYSFYFGVNLCFAKLIMPTCMEKLAAFQNLPTQKMYQQAVSDLRFFSLIGMELVALLFFIIIQPFARTSCFAGECINELNNYIHIRYVFIIGLSCYKLLKMLKNYVQEGIDTTKMKNDQYMGFAQRYASFIQFVKKQTDKHQIRSNLQDQALFLFRSSLFSIFFPICTAITLSSVLIECLLHRIDVLRNRRRPINKSEFIDPFSENYRLMIHIVIIFNCWTSIFTYEILEYNFVGYIRAFVSTPTESGIFILKIITVFVLIGLIQLVYFIVFYVARSLIIDPQMLRKKIKYDQHLKKKTQNIKAEKSFLQLLKLRIVKTIFRTYNYIQSKYRKMLIEQEPQEQDQKMSKTSILNAAVRDSMKASVTKPIQDSPTRKKPNSKLKLGRTFSGKQPSKTQ